MVKDFHLAPSNYMLLDVSGAKCQLVLVAPSPHVQLHARLLKAKDPERKLIAPPLKEESLYKLTYPQAMALLISLGGVVGVSPTKLYSDLLALLLAQPLSTASSAFLQAEVERLGLPEPVIGWEHMDVADLMAAKVTVVKAKVKRTTDTSFANPLRPKSGTTTGLVWEICDGLHKSLGRMPTSAEAVVACDKEEISKGTTSVQYGKWKKFTSPG